MWFVTIFSELMRAIGRLRYDLDPVAFVAVIAAGLAATVSLPGRS